MPLSAVKALLKISPATIDRIFKPIRIKYIRQSRSTTKPGTLLRKSIPIKTDQWDEARPGFLEADTVAHCGDTVAGMFIYTVNLVDIATGWTEQRAVWGKGETGVLEEIKDVKARLPFPLRGFDCDNGGEFINYHLIKHFGNKINPVQFTRSRPYHKDDNAHVDLLFEFFLEIIASGKAKHLRALLFNISLSYIITKILAYLFKFFTITITNTRYSYKVLHLVIPILNSSLNATKTDKPSRSQPACLKHQVNKFILLLVFYLRIIRSCTLSLSLFNEGKHYKKALPSYRVPF